VIGRGLQPREVCGGAAVAERSRRLQVSSTTAPPGSSTIRAAAGSSDHSRPGASLNCAMARSNAA